ncbi:MAG: hypothetical protein AB1485_05775 [Candidatus Thermoplasmatota archaeon]
MGEEELTATELCPYQSRVESPYLHYVCNNPRYLTEIGIEKPRMTAACKNWRSCPSLKKDDKRR